MRPILIALRRLQPLITADTASDQCEIIWLDHLNDPTDPALQEALPRANGLIGAGFTITSEFLDKAPQLKVISAISVGVDNYPVAELTQRRILLCNTPDVLTETTADTAFALILAAARRVTELERWIRNGQWRSAVAPSHFGVDVHGKTLGVLGLGRIGDAIARRGALGFGMQIRYALSSPKPELEATLGARRCELDALLATSDFICCTLPLSDETRHLISHDQFAQMQPHAIFINVGRGPVVDEHALAEALSSGQIRAAGLDVFEQEPLPETSPLLALENVVLLPHVGSATTETRQAMAQRAVDNVLRALTGERPPSPVNPEVLEQRPNTAQHTP